MPMCLRVWCIDGCVFMFDSVRAELLEVHDERRREV